MFAFAEITHHSLETGYTNQLLFVKVVELTHEKSLNKRAIIEYTYKGENLRHFIPRDRLIAPNIVHSEVLFYHYASGWEYCVEARADFFKHPDECFVNMTTKHFITELKVNGHKMVDAAEAAEYMNADQHELQRKILAKLVEYVDELPF
jgi:hypothetical protein